LGGREDSLRLVVSPEAGVGFPPPQPCGLPQCPPLPASVTWTA
jgi:hypothetical protein